MELEQIIGLGKQAGKRIGKYVHKHGEPLKVDGLSSELSIYSVQGHETLNEPWYYDITVTSSDKAISADNVLGQTACFSFLVSNLLHGSESLLSGSQGKDASAKSLLQGDKKSEGFAGLRDIAGTVETLWNATDKVIDVLKSSKKKLQPRRLHGVVSEFRQLSVNDDEARYCFRIVPRLALFDAHKNRAIYQNESVVNVLEKILRKHDFTGVDYRLELKNTYPVREFITQWDESDLVFLRRILSDVGIWMRFESHSQHNCDVVVFSDDEKGYKKVDKLLYNEPSGMVDGMRDSVWGFRLSSQVVSNEIILNDYNYRKASADMLANAEAKVKDPTHLEDLANKHLGKDVGKAVDKLMGESALKPYSEYANEAGSLLNKGKPAKNKSTHGAVYLYGEHYKDKGESSSKKKKVPRNTFVANGDKPDLNKESSGPEVESGKWYASLRLQQAHNCKLIVEGKTNSYQLVPGQRVEIDKCPLTGAKELIILTVESQADRSSSYEATFTAMPYSSSLPYRPFPMAWPQVSGSVSARVSSPDNDTYGYIDTQGRYRVKLNFDRQEWKAGEESLWVRLAKPYAGDTYGFHFPLIDGTEVAIAFTDGNPDRPYIAHAMHDSTHPDPVTTENKHRNVLRTPANNKLRMDDKRGQEHIKLATEYGKTQLNLGHLVDSEKEKRGEGFELRTDEWGAIRAGKGLYITTEEQNKADGLQLQMDNAAKELEQAVYMVKQLNDLAQAAKAELADLQTQKQLLEQSLNDLKQPAILNYAPAGIADVTPASIQQTAGENIIQTAQSTVDISAFKRFMVTAGNMISLFANAMGIKIFAAKGKVEIQAQDDVMELTAKQDMKITSTDSEVIISANKKLTLTCDGVAIVLEGGGIKLIAPGDVQALAASFGVLGPSNYSAPASQLPAGTKCREDLS